MTKSEEPVWGARIRRLREGEVALIYDYEASPSTVRKWCARLGEAMGVTFVTKDKPSLKLIYVGNKAWPHLKGESRGIGFGHPKRGKPDV